MNNLAWSKILYIGEVHTHPFLPLEYNLSIHVRIIPHLWNLFILH